MKVPLKIIGLIIAISANCVGQSEFIADSIRKEIPTRSDGEPDLFYQLTKQKESQLILDNLEEGYDSLQIRIWYDYSLTDFRELVIFKYQNDIWEGKHYKYRVDWDFFNRKVTVLEKEFSEITPKSGWEIFTSYLFEKRIIELPDMREIEGLEDDIKDGVSYSVEIGTKNSYRFYNYHLPGFYTDFWQAKYMNEILKKIESEFGIEYKIQKN
ncbi:MAG: hypothetical protein R2759_15450 [Bacteroidales bacterium]